MKIIHTADIHLDSRLVGVADSKLRRTELLRALRNMAEFANNNGVEAIIVAGDLFDEKFTTEQTVQSVVQIVNLCKAKWFVLRGNHGSISPYRKLEVCSQINFFGDTWTGYNLENVCIIGRELGKNDAEQWQELSCDASKFNIVVLHGDIDDDSYGLIDKKVLAAQPINYVALGHRHTFAQHKFGKVKACYSGVLEARGFDEGESGFVVIDTETGNVQFHPQHIRRVEKVTLDVSAITTDAQLFQAVLDSVSAVNCRNYLNLVFEGTLAEGVRLLPVAEEALQNRFFALRLQNSTTMPYDLAELQQEISLRGEFVKLALQISDEKFREEVLALGLAALNGEV